MIKIYNSLTKKIEDFKPIKENELTMYVCGPTVYNFMHIGNSRPIIFFDVVARFFKYLGYKVTYVSNFTDIDDKIITRAEEEGISEAEVSEKYIKEISETYNRLNIIPHDKNPKVTENMQEIIDYIGILITKGGAYVSDGDVYFDVSKIDNYGVLSSQTIENLIQGARVETNDKKKNPVDFTLWKETLTGLRWQSPWSEGRPGWHTECVVMINNIFKGKIDIHGGGLDLKFPHHDNEIAQSMCSHDHTIANYWMHNGRIDLSGEKMSKSVGNVIWANDLLDKVDYQIYRFMVLNVPYRQPLNYREELLDQAATEYEKIRRSYNNLYRKIELEDIDLGKKDSEIEKLKTEFIEAMSNDFNTANAITSIINLSKLSNTLLRAKELDREKLASCYSLFTDMLWVLGIETNIEPLEEEDKKLVREYEAARRAKNFELSDELRKQIADKGILL
ncbi:MAG: cysteine--tRNA ligase [Bacilli bacterium]|nr:cysteine--tRNA ligase [Bacilli bacterium]